MDYSAAAISDLVDACVQGGDAAAWEEFQRRYHRVIAVTVLRVVAAFEAADPELVDDLIQDTYLKLCADRCRVLRDNRAEHAESLGAFLKRIAHNVAVDHFRGSTAKKRGGGARQEALTELSEAASSSIEFAGRTASTGGFVEGGETGAVPPRDVSSFPLGGFPTDFGMRRAIQEVREAR